MVTSSNPLPLGHTNQRHRRDGADQTDIVRRRLGRRLWLYRLRPDLLHRHRHPPARQLGPTATPYRNKGAHADGILKASSDRIGEITDGASNTIMIGEDARPRRASNSKAPTP